MSNHNRVLPGTPSGGEFAERTYDSDTIILSDAYDRLVEKGGLADFTLAPEEIAALTPAALCAISDHYFPADVEFPECSRCGVDMASAWPDDGGEGYEDFAIDGVVIASSRHIQL